RRGYGLVFFGPANDLMKILAEIFRRDLLKFLADLVNDARQPVACGKSEHGETGSDLSGSEVNRCDGPGLGHRLDKIRTQGRRAASAGLETIQSASQLGCKAAFVDFGMLRDEGEIGIGRIEQFEQIVLNLDVVVSTGETESRRGFRGVSSCCVELSYEGSEI